MIIQLHWLLRGINCYLQVNKMMCFKGDYLERSQKAERTRLYRDMLDEQVRQNRAINARRMRQEYKQPIWYQDSYRGKDLSLPDRLELSRGLPYIEPKKSSTAVNPLWKNSLGRYNHLSEEQEDTEAYLNNCEQILRRLRNIKLRKKQYVDQKTPRIVKERPPYEQSHPYFSRPAYFPRFNSCQLRGNSTKQKSINKKIQKLRRPSYARESRIKREKKQLETKPSAQGLQVLSNKEQVSVKMQQKGHQLKTLQLFEQAVQKHQREQPTQKHQKDHVSDRSASEKKAKSLTKEQVRDVPTSTAEKTHWESQMVSCFKELTAFLKQQSKSQSQHQGQPQNRNNTNHLYRASPAQTEERQKQNQIFQKQLKAREDNLKRAVLHQLKTVNQTGINFLQKIEHYRERETASQFSRKRTSRSSLNGSLMTCLHQLMNSKESQCLQVLECMKELLAYLKNFDKNEIQVQNVVEKQISATERKVFKEPKISPKVRKINQEESAKTVLRTQNNVNDQSDKPQTDQQELNKFNQAIVIGLKKAKMKGHLFIEKMENIKKQRKSNMTNKKSLLGKIHLEELKVAPKTVNFVHETSKVVEMEENPQFLVDKIGRFETENPILNSTLLSETPQNKP